MSPSVDVMIPFRDGSKLTRSCLEQLTRQTLAHRARRKYFFTDITP